MVEKLIRCCCVLDINPIVFCEVIYYSITYNLSANHLRQTSFESLVPFVDILRTSPCYIAFLEHNISTDTYIIDRTDDSITIPGIYKGSVTSFPNMTVTVERKVPDMAFITECNNRLWGCSTDGHEIYCCKLGDVKNWNCFRGTSTDSWAATVGSDGKWTGAITYLGYPMFFKEDGLIKISVSGSGAHQTKETVCRGVQSGSDRSLAIINETLFYKSRSAICAYDG
jgi:hypothetical protein